MGDVGKVKAAGRPQGGIAVDPAGLNRRSDATERLVAFAETLTLPAAQWKQPFVSSIARTHP
jgi:hypothetical protein